MSKAYGYKPSSIAGGVGVRHPEGRVYLNCSSGASLWQLRRIRDLRGLYLTLVYTPGRRVLETKTPM